MVRAVIITEPTIIRVTLIENQPVSVTLADRKIIVKKEGTKIGSFNAINFKEGANTTIAVTENGRTADVEIASTGGGGGTPAADQSETNAGTEAAKYVAPSTHAGYHRRGRTVSVNDAIVQTDQDGIIVFNSATPINFTIEELLIRTTVGFINIGTGTVTFLNGTGVTIDGITSLSEGSTATIYYFLPSAPILISGGSDAVWGGITGTLTDQTDLSIALRNARNFGLININGIKL